MLVGGHEEKVGEFEAGNEMAEAEVVGFTVFCVAALHGLWGVWATRIPRADARGNDVAPRCAGCEVERIPRWFV